MRWTATTRKLIVVNYNLWFWIMSYSWQTVGKLRENHQIGIYTFGGFFFGNSQVCLFDNSTVANVKTKTLIIKKYTVNDIQKKNIERYWKFAQYLVTHLCKKNGNCVFIVISCITAIRFNKFVCWLRNFLGVGCFFFIFWFSSKWFMWVAIDFVGFKCYGKIGALCHFTINRFIDKRTKLNGSKCKQQ